ncbi:MAG TPA: hypothetical protein VGL56_03945 [Fimbriimonadaceae bacterium]|jgi:hypothetical protein
MDKRTAVIVGLSGVLLYGLSRLLWSRLEEAERCREFQKANKRVDLSSEDSFPASDPPSWTAQPSATMR